MHGLHPHGLERDSSLFLSLISSVIIILIKKVRVGGVAQVVQHLPNKYEALSSSPSATKKRKEKQSKQVTLTVSGGGVQGKGPEAGKSQHVLGSGRNLARVNGLCQEAGVKLELTWKP
jgi:hypothetical protein